MRRSSMARRPSRSMRTWQVRSPVPRRIATEPAHLPETVLSPSGCSRVAPSLGLPPTLIWDIHNDTCVQP